MSKIGALPGGVTFTDNNNGTAGLAGMPVAGSGGIYTFTVTAANSIAPNATQTFTLIVNEAPTITMLVATTFTVGSAGSFTVTTGHDFPAATTLSETGILPGGVTFTDNGIGTATLAGTPDLDTDGFYTFTITAANSIGSASQTFTLTVNQESGLGMQTITSAANATFTVGTAGSFTVTTSHDFPATTTLSETGNLPSGVTFTDNGNGTATLAGTPAANTAGMYPLTFTPRMAWARPPRPSP